MSKHSQLWILYFNELYLDCCIWDKTAILIEQRTFKLVVKMICSEPTLQ